MFFIVNLFGIENHEKEDIFNKINLFIEEFNKYKQEEESQRKLIKTKIDLLLFKIEENYKYTSKRLEFISKNYEDLLQVFKSSIKQIQNALMTIYHDIHEIHEKNNKENIFLQIKNMEKKIEEIQFQITQLRNIWKKNECRRSY